MNCNGTGARCEWQSWQLSVHDVVTSLAQFEAPATACAVTSVEASRRSELITENYAHHTSHPFSCSYETSHPFSFQFPSSHPFRCG